MATLHAALKSLAPTPFSDVPASSPDDSNYLHELFQKAQLVVESIPPPPEHPDPAATRPRSNTAVSAALSASEISSSSYRSAPASPEYAALQKEWGKPIKLSAKDNPLNMGVYKLGGKDGRGAWFARRSVHEGMGFAKWKKGLEMEFPETMEVQGAPGEGNIRGIGGERRVERKIIKGAGKVEVYHLSAQFPGPTTPRDFVTLLITSTTAMNDGDTDRLGPRHYMIISKPCIHPECPPRDGFIRGQYESVEFIREVPLRPKTPSSSADVGSMNKGRANSPGVGKAAMLRNAEQRSHTFPLHHDNKSEGNLSHAEQLHLTIPEASVSDGETHNSSSRRRGKTISYAESRGRQAKGEDFDHPHTEDDEAETNPVEWIMITRSDPGGSVPRFMVERGTPGSIVADAVKFLDWACQKEHIEDDEEEEGGEHVDQIPRRGSQFHDYELNGHLAGLDGHETDELEYQKSTLITESTQEKQTPSSIPQSPKPVQDKQTIPSIPRYPQSIPETLTQSGILASVAQAVTASLEMYAPQVVIDHLPGHQHEHSQDSTEMPLPPSESIAPVPAVDHFTPQRKDSDKDSISSASSVLTFASADSHISELRSSTSKSPSSQSKEIASTLTPHEKELQKLQLRKQRLDEKLVKTREKESKVPSNTEKEIAAIKRAEEKHAKEVQRQEEKYKREVAKLQEKKEKDAKKQEEKKKKAEEKDERIKLLKERDEAKSELDMLKKEKDIWMRQVRELQRENTMLVAKIGRMNGGSAGSGSASDTDLYAVSGAAVSPGSVTSVPGALVGTTASAGAAPAAQGIGANVDGAAGSPEKEKKKFLKDMKDVGGRMRGLTIESMGVRSRSGSLRRDRKDSRKDGSLSPEADRKAEADKESVAS